MNFLEGLTGGGSHHEDYQDFAHRYDQGHPSEGYSDEEVLDRHQQVAGELASGAVSGGSAAGIRAPVAARTPGVRAVLAAAGIPESRSGWSRSSAATGCRLSRPDGRSDAATTARDAWSCPRRWQHGNGRHVRRWWYGRNGPRRHAGRGTWRRRKPSGQSDCKGCNGRNRPLCLQTHNRTIAILGAVVLPLICRVIANPRLERRWRLRLFSASAATYGGLGVDLLFSLARTRLVRSLLYCTLSAQVSSADMPVVLRFTKWNGEEST